MGEDVPLDLARSRRRQRAGPVARDASDPGLRGAAPHRSERGDAGARRAGGDPHVAGRDQAGMSLSGRAGDRPADPTRAASPSRCRSTCRSPRSIGWSTRSSRAIFRKMAAAVRDHGAGAKIAPSGDRLLLSLRIKAREEDLLRLRRRGDRQRLGSAGARSRAADRAARRHRPRLESEAAFGLLGAAAKAAMPYLQGRARRQCDDRSQAVRRPTPAEHRSGHGGVPHRRRPACGSTSASPVCGCWASSSTPDPEGDRGSERDRQCGGKQPAAMIGRGLTPMWIELCKNGLGARRSGARGRPEISLLRSAAIIVPASGEP